MGRLSPKPSGVHWQPYCGAEYGGPLANTGEEVAAISGWARIGGALVAGHPVVCDEPSHLTTQKHRCSELGFSWW